MSDSQTDVSCLVESTFEDLTDDHSTITYSVVEASLAAGKQTREYSDSDGYKLDVHLTVHDEEDRASDGDDKNIVRKQRAKPSLLSSNSQSSLPPDHFANRLYNSPKCKPKPVLKDAIVSDLPNDSLKWIKQRRTMDSNQRVVISYIRNRQLLEMFKTLDFNSNGSIELSELKEAINYAKQRMTGGDAIKHFQNLDKVFEDMDDNGDGTVDYQEFAKGMTGTANSVFDRVSAFEIDKLFTLFIEYGAIRCREITVKAIDHKRPVTSQVPRNESRKMSPTGPINGKDNHSPAEIDEFGPLVYQNFKLLFGGGNGKKSTVLEDESGTPIWQLGKKRFHREEKLLNRFVEENQLHTVGAVVSQNVDGTVTATNTLSDDVLEKEKTYRSLHDKQHYARGDLVEDLSTDFGILDIQNRIKKEREWKSPSKPNPNNHLPSISPDKFHRNTSSANGRADMNIRLKVKQEAFDVIREGSRDEVTGMRVTNWDQPRKLHSKKSPLFRTMTHLKSDDSSREEKFPTLEGVDHIHNSDAMNSFVFCRRIPGKL